MILTVIVCGNLESIVHDERQKFSSVDEVKYLKIYVILANTKRRFIDGATYITKLLVY